ncbi:unnamed protein product [Phytophthora fragariaefolia]|uniref:Unnamed protein product n=1 Tax=Phytophthora fragariaefolia TaxID=1490495 RepID=A0A9W7CWI3_9STRA|nr:unnamed protein product [Phytophthora fragariaefolia]
MYVTRRLLRSTMPSPPADEKETREEKPPHTPKRRAAVRASARIGEVVADASGPAARSRAAKTPPPQTENGGDEKNKSRSHAKKRKEEKKQQQQHKKKENETPAVDTSKLHGYQLMVDVHYRGEQFAEARVLDLDPDRELLFVHYMGWNARFDAWVPLEEVAAHGSRSGVAKKKDVSWDGDISLFATEEEAAVQRQKGKAKAKATKAKKRNALSPKARQAARKALQTVSTDRKRHAEQVIEPEEAQPAATRVVKRSPKNAKTAKKNTKKSPRAGKKVSSKKSLSSPARRTSRRVQVVVGTTDEDSERKNESETADLVLDVEVEGCEASNDEAEEEEEVAEDVVEEEGSPRRSKKRATAKTKTRRKGNNVSPGGPKRKRDTTKDVVEVSASTPTGAKRSPANKSKKSKKTGAVNKAADQPTAAVKTAPLPPQSGRGGLGSDTREKLAAIFRLRVQQRQQMEQMNASQAGFQQSLQEQEGAEEATKTAETTDSSNETTEAEGSNFAMANPELAAAEEYQRQLQQFYYHQQVMLANSLSMSVAGGEDLSAIPLQGGIMDPRIIQDRLTALEERRRQQAHVQAYYQQLMLTRERNVRALAANQAFVNASAAVWEQQLKDTQSEDGTSSVTSWKDVTGADTSEPGKGSPKAAEATATESDADGDGDGDSDTASAKVSETSSAAPAVSTSTDVTSPDTVEKAAETSPTKSASDKCDPADAPAENVLYEFVL